MSRHGLLRNRPASGGNNNEGGGRGVAVHPVLKSKKKQRCGEVMGGAAAECSVVVCCCPFAIMDALVLALYKAPTGMCRKAIDRSRRKRKNKQRLLKQRANEAVSDDEMCKEEFMAIAAAAGKVGDEDEDAMMMEAVDLEMHDRFYGTGFWRSDSQRSMSL